MNNQKCIETIINHRKRLLTFKKLVEQFPDDFPYSMEVWGFSLIEIVINKIEELQEVRKALREIFGSWEDKMNEIYPWADGSVRIYWLGEVQDVRIKIKYYCTQDTLPEGIQKPGCRFEKYTNEDVKYVCEIKGEISETRNH